MSATSATDTVVNYTISGSAVLGQDYILSGTVGQVVIPAGQSSATVLLTALNDGVAEDKETVTLTLAQVTTGKNFATVMIEKQKAKDKKH